MKYLILLIACCCISSCKTNRVCKGQRVGLWIEIDTIEGIAYTSRGRYKKGMEVGKWRYLNNQAIIKIEKYRDSICVTTYYHPNRMKPYKAKRSSHSTVIICIGSTPDNGMNMMNTGTWWT